MIYGYSSIHTCTYWYPLHVCMLYAMYALISTVTHRSWIDYMPGSYTHPTFTEWEPLTYCTLTIREYWLQDVPIDKHCQTSIS